jgi:hypothetical protein
MHIDSPEEIVAVRETAKRFVERRILPIVEKDYEDGTARRKIMEEMGPTPARPMRIR